MQRYVWGVAILLVLGIALFLVETHRTWGVILFLLALIFYGLFANPMHMVHKATFGEKPKSSRRSSRRKKK